MKATYRIDTDKQVSEILEIERPRYPVVLKLLPGVTTFDTKNFVGLVYTGGDDLQDIASQTFLPVTTPSVETSFENVYWNGEQVITEQMFDTLQYVILFPEYIKDASIYNLFTLDASIFDQVLVLENGFKEGTLLAGSINNENFQAPQGIEDCRASLLSSLGNVIFDSKLKTYPQLYTSESMAELTYWYHKRMAFWDKTTLKIASQGSFEKIEVYEGIEFYMYSIIGRDPYPWEENISGDNALSAAPTGGSPVFAAPDTFDDSRPS